MKQAWLVLALALCFGAALAVVQVAWGPKIEQNKENDARSQIPRLVVGAGADLTPAGRNVEIRDERGLRAYRVYRAMCAGEGGRSVQIGWVVKAKGPGYADNIELLVGLDLKAETITGLAVLAQNETPGLGNAIKAPAWRRQFAGKAAGGRLEAVKGTPHADCEIEAVSGATISSQSVCDIVNRAVADFRAKLPELRDEE